MTMCTLKELKGMIVIMKEKKKENNKDKNSRIWWRKKPDGEVVLTPAGKFELLMSLVSFQMRDDYDKEFLKLLRFIRYNFNLSLRECLIYGINMENKDNALDIIMTNRHYIELFFDTILSQSGADQFGKFRPNILPSSLLDYFLSDTYQEEAESLNLPNTLKDINNFIRKKLAYHDVEFFEKAKSWRTYFLEKDKILTKTTE